MLDHRWAWMTGFFGEQQMVWQRSAEWALAGVQREFPHQFPLLLSGPTCYQRPRDLTPVFYGCFDWHSAVHGHWTLLIVWEQLPSGPLRTAIDRCLCQQFEPAGLRREVEFLAAPDRQGFERPYGLAWILAVDALLRDHPHPLAGQWRTAWEPLAAIANQRLSDFWSRLAWPIRSGEHSQTAFALARHWDWAVSCAAEAVQQAIRDTAERFYADDRGLPFRWEPSGTDFVSPGLGELDVMARVWPAERFASWLDAAVPEGILSLSPVTVSDPEDGKLAHFAGLNFSRAAMLWSLARRLPSTDARQTPWAEQAAEHWETGLAALESTSYAITHWVGTFAIWAEREAARLVTTMTAIRPHANATLG